MIDFGTGMKTPLTNTAPADLRRACTPLYGIWDWNMSSWNAKSTARLVKPEHVADARRCNSKSSFRTAGATWTGPPTQSVGPT